MQARFSLQGELLAPDVDLPTHLGLHHHGEEAEVIMGPREDWAAFNNQGPLVRCLGLPIAVHGPLHPFRFLAQSFSSFPHFPASSLTSP